MRLINKEVLMQKVYMLSVIIMYGRSHIFYALPEMTDTQSIKSRRILTAVMYDCMQLKVKITIFHVQSVDLLSFTTEITLAFEY